jgi:hypothetical protein
MTRLATNFRNKLNVFIKTVQWNSLACNGAHDNDNESGDNSVSLRSFGF